MNKLLYYICIHTVLNHLSYSPTISRPLQQLSFYLMVGEGRGGGADEDEGASSIMLSLRCSLDVFTFTIMFIAFRLYHLQLFNLNSQLHHGNWRDSLRRHSLSLTSLSMSVRWYPYLSYLSALSREDK